MSQSVKIELWFESVEEMIDVMENSPLVNRPLPRHVRGTERLNPIDRPAIDPNEPKSDLDENMSNLAGLTSVDEEAVEPEGPLKARPNAAPPPARPRKRRAYLRHKDGRCIETMDQDVVDQWISEGAQYVTRKQFDIEMALMPTEPSGQSAGEPVHSVEVSNVGWDDVRDVVRRVSAECSLTRLRELLAEFGHSRVSELTQSEYAPFVRAAAKAIEKEASHA